MHLGMFRHRRWLQCLEERTTPAMFTVTNTLNSGAGSLRQAVINANAAAGADTIDFDPSVFATPKSIILTTGQITVTGSVSVIGPGAALTTVSGNKASRLFNIDGAGTLAVGFLGLTLRDGNAQQSDIYAGCVLIANEAVTMTDCVIAENAAYSAAGAIFAAAAGSKLTLVRCQIYGNSTTAINQGQGGAIIGTTGSIVTIQDCTLTGNSTFVSGGAVAAGGVLTLLGSTLSGNICSSGYSRGGAVYFIGTELAIRDCTISGNSANVSPFPAGGGGGIYLNYGSAQAKVLISNSTISRNQTIPNGVGGGIDFSLFSGSTLIENCTITENSAGSRGGGINGAANGKLTLQSTIVAGNASPLGPDINSGYAIPVNYGGNNNVVGVADDGKFLLSGTGNLTGTLANPLDAKLAALDSNGGPTQTHALLPGSPCIDAGSNPANLLTDQRGDGFARVVGVAVDIGAFEVQPPRISDVLVNNGAVQRSRVTDIGVNFDQAVTLPANAADAFQLKRQSDNAAIALSAIVAGNSVILAFDAGPLDANSLADGRYTLMALASQIPNLDGNGDGIPGDNYTSPANLIHRLFGDADGDADVDTSDFAALRGAFGSNNATFDFDNDGVVDTADLGQFRGRFGTVI